MKNRQLRFLLEEVTTDLQIVSTKNTDTLTGYSTLKISKLKQLRKGIHKLEKASLFESETQKIKESILFTTSNDSVTITGNEGEELFNEIGIIGYIVKSTAEILKSNQKEEDNNSISIKFPDLQDFEDLSYFSTEINKILKQSIVNDEINGSVKINNVENGSIWFDVYLGSTAAVSLVGGLTWAAAVIFKKIQEGRIIQQHVESLGIKNESLKEIKEKQKEALELLIEGETKNLYNENFKKENNEQFQRLKYCVKMLSELIEKGAEIHPALNQPESVKNLYPKNNELEKIESKIRKIE